MSQPFDLSKPNRPIRVGVILVNGVTEILDTAPIDFFSGMSNDFCGALPDELWGEHLAAKKQALDFEFHWVSETGKATNCRLTSGISLTPTHSFENCPQLDIVLMGAHMIGYEPNQTELAFVRKAYEECSAFLTICGGVMVPLQAGILDGKTATAPRLMLPNLYKQVPGTKWVDRRYANDGKLWTSGALLNGLDLMSAFAKATWGDRELIHFQVKAGGWPDRGDLYLETDIKA